MRLLLKAKMLPFVLLDLDSLGHSEYASIDIRVSQPLSKLSLSLSTEQLQRRALLGACFLVLATNSSFQQAAMTTETAANPWAGWTLPFITDEEKVCLLVWLVIT
jgi:hypothetical protein